MLMLLSIQSAVKLFWVNITGHNQMSLEVVDNVCFTFP